jgi:hypothetical protein
VDIESPVADLVPAGLPPTPHRRRPFWIALAVVVVAIPTMIIATSGGESESPLEVLAAASARTTGSSTARMTSVESITADGITEEVIDLAGEIDFTENASASTLSSRGQLFAEHRFIGGVAYMSSPFVGLPKGAHWIAVGAEDTGLLSSAGLGSSEPDTRLGSSYPITGLKFLSAIEGDAEVAGREKELDGTETTKYTFTLDLETYFDDVANAPDETGGPLEIGPFESLGGGIDLSNVSAAAWIDGDGRVRKLVITLEQSGGGYDLTDDNTYEFSHFDEPVSISAPAPFETIPESEYPSFFRELFSAAGAAMSS